MLHVVKLGSLTIVVYVNEWIQNICKLELRLKSYNGNKVVLNFTFRLPRRIWYKISLE